MFAVVKMTEKEGGLRNRIRKSRITAERISLHNGDCFFIIRAEKTKKYFPYEEIVTFSGRLRNSLLFDSSAPLSCSSLRAELLQRKLLFITAEKFFQEAGLVPSDTSLCLYDDEGIYCQELHRLLPFASRLHVVSSHASYAHRLTELLDEYGASVTLNGSLGKKEEKSSVIISFDSSRISTGFGGTLITDKPGHLPLARCITSLPVSLPENYRSYLPEGVDSTLFASALYEKCHCEDILRHCAADI